MVRVTTAAAGVESTQIIKFCFLQNARLVLNGILSKVCCYEDQIAKQTTAVKVAYKALCKYSMKSAQNFINYTVHLQN